MWNCGEIYLALIYRTRATLPVSKEPLSAWYFLFFTPNVDSFVVVLSLESMFEYSNPVLTGIILGMSLGNSLEYLIDSISHIHWCGHWIETWKFLWRFNWVPYLLFSWLGTWHNTWYSDGTFTWQLYGQVSWGISRISFVLLFDSTLEALFEYYTGFNFIQFIVDIPLGSKVRHPDLFGSPSQATISAPPSGSGLGFP